MLNLLTYLIITIAIFIPLVPMHADTEFEIYMNDFYRKQEMASKLLKELEIDLKGGSRERVCSRQVKAANYGIEATNSLIKAFEISGNLSEIDNIKVGLNKWRELRDYC